jgi:hypothetical protein
MNAGESSKPSTPIGLTKIVVFALVGGVVTASLRPYPDIGTILGFWSGGFAAWAIKPRTPALWRFIVVLACLSVVYLCIMHWPISK